MSIASRLRHHAKWIRHKVTPGALILLYHRVADLPADPQLLCVTPKHFSEQMEVLRDFGTPISLVRLSAALRDRKLPGRSIVVTFDDGYADNLHCAKPVLERFEVPAAVFVAGGCIGKRTEYWWDELERILLVPGQLPESLHLKVNGITVHWQLGDFRTYTEQDYRKHERWNVGERLAPTERHALYRVLHQTIRPLPDGQRRDVLASLQDWAGCGSEGRRTHRSMTPSELQSLADGELIEVGAHTVTHPVLSAIPLDTQRQEITHGRVLLEEMLNRPVTSFAYPYGGIRDYTPETVMAVREAGFECACSNYPGVVRRRSDCFQMPRALARDWGADEFARRLREWFLDG